MTRPRSGPFLVGVVANLVIAAAAATAWAAARPMFSTGDEAAHLDYAYQVWLGRLPVFEDGLALHQTFGVHPPVQWTAQHPPLFYLLLAPFVGPLAEADHVLVAGLAGRAVNTVITMGLVAAVMWASSALAPGRRTLWLASGTVAALYPLTSQVGGAVYNDNLFATWAALSVGLTARMVRRGATTKRLLLFSLVAAAAFWTRSASVVVVGVCAATVGAGLLVLRPRRWLVAGVGLVAAVAAAAASSAWFYLRNQRLSGNLLGGHFDYLPHRVRRPLPEVITRSEVWDQLVLIHGYGWVDRHLATLLLVGLPLAAAAVVGARAVIISRRVVPELALVVLLVGLTGAVLLMQLLYVTAGGGASERYLAPLTVVIAFAVASGLTAVRPLTPVLVGLWSALEFGTLAAYVLASLHWVSLYSPAPVLPVATVIAVVAGSAAIVVALLVQIVLAAGGPALVGGGAPATGPRGT